MYVYGSESAGPSQLFSPSVTQHDMNTTKLAMMDDVRWMDARAPNCRRVHAWLGYVFFVLDRKIIAKAGQN